MSSFLILVGVILTVSSLVRYYRWLTHHSIEYIRGPISKSRLLGELIELFRQ